MKLFRSVEVLCLSTLSENSEELPKLITHNKTKMVLNMDTLGTYETHRFDLGIFGMNLAYSFAKAISAIYSPVY